MTATGASYRDYDVIALPQDMRISVMTTLAPHLSQDMDALKSARVVLDMSQVTEFDSSTIRLLLNIRKRLDTAGKNLFLLRPSREFTTVLEKTRLIDTFVQIESTVELQAQIERNRFSGYTPYVREEDGLNRLRAVCPVCGAETTAGYVVDHSSLSWSWIHDDLFPSCTTAAGEPFDFFGLLPIVCLECYFTSIEPEHWNLVDGAGQACERSTLNEHAKMLLAKSIKKRRKMVEADPDVTANSFLHPRKSLPCFRAYQLAESCARALAVMKTDASLFEIGYINYLALRYAPPEEKEGLINNCRTWLMQAVVRRDGCNHLHIAQAYFILLGAALSMQKAREASQLYTDFSAYILTLGHHHEGSGISSPHFWFTQCESVWRHEIAAKSHLLRAQE